MDKLEFKVKTNIQSLSKQADEWKQQGKQIVFTNGCFDILHQGHVRYLTEAKSLGDILIVGINSDNSVRALKGPERPFNDAYARAIVLAGLSAVDAIIEFDEDTPLRLIQTISPDILVKGGDWPVEKIVGSEFVFSKGGQVKSLKFWQGYSTTAIAEKIKKYG